MFSFAHMLSKNIHFLYRKTKINIKKTPHSVNEFKIIIIRYKYNNRGHSNVKFKKKTIFFIVGLATGTGPSKILYICFIHVLHGIQIVIISYVQNASTTVSEVRIRSKAMSQKFVHTFFTY